MDKKFILLIFIFLLVFSVFTGSLFLAQNERTVRASKRTPAPNPRSLCLASVLTAKIGENVPLTCVSRDIDNNKVVGAQCRFDILTGTGTTLPRNGTSDENGMVETQLTSQSEGIVEVQCVINDSINAGNVSVQFIP